MDKSNNKKDIKRYKDEKQIVSFSYDKGYNFSTDSNSYILIAKKSQKVLSAIYMISDFLDENDPIRLTLRENATMLMSDMFYCISMVMSDRAETISKGQNLLEQIISFLEVIHINKQISEMNFNILYDELLILQNTLSKQFKKLMLFKNNTNKSIEEFTFPESTFSKNNDLSQIVKSKSNSINKEVLPTFSRGASGGLKKVKDININDIKKDIGKDIKDSFYGKGKVISKGQNNKKNIFNKIDDLNVVNSKSERKDVILNLLKQKEELSIKDITALFVGKSEKTIQRDLGELINDGFVIKTGEKRWSRYSLFFG